MEATVTAQTDRLLSLVLVDTTPGKGSTDQHRPADIPKRLSMRASTHLEEEEQQPLWLETGA